MTRHMKVLVCLPIFWQLGAQLASAEGDKVGTIAVSLVGGPAMVTTESLRDAYEIGWALEARLAYCLSSHFSVLPVRGNIARFSVADDPQPGVTEKLRVSSFVPSVLIALDNERNVNPFLLAGVGLYRQRAEATSTDFGMDVGAGIEFAVGSTAAINFEARLSRINGADLTFVPFINFGLTYYFGAN